MKLAKACGIKVERGIVVDSHMRTSHPDVYAVDDPYLALFFNYQTNLAH